MNTRRTARDTDPVRTARADQFRIAATVILPPDDPRFAELEGALELPEHRKSEQGYGIALLESETDAVTYVGSIRQLEDFGAANSDGTGVLDVSHGLCYGSWPQAGGWDQVVPRTTWNPGGEGVVAEYDHRGTAVVVYEFLRERGGEQVPMVAFHCLHCHNDHAFFHDHATENSGPADRRWMAGKARAHIRHAQHECRPLDPRHLEAVAQVAKQKLGPGAVVPAPDAQCAADGPCAEIRHAKARAATR